MFSNNQQSILLMMKETNNTNSTEETTRNTNAIVRCPCETEEEFDALGWVQCDGCELVLL